MSATADEHCGWNESTTSRRNLIRIGFIPTNGFDRESHQCDAKDENLCTSSGFALLLRVVVESLPGDFAEVVDDPLYLAFLLLSLGEKVAKFRLSFIPPCFDRLIG